MAKGTEPKLIAYRFSFTHNFIHLLRFKSVLFKNFIKFSTHQVRIRLHVVWRHLSAEFWSFDMRLRRSGNFFFLSNVADSSILIRVHHTHSSWWSTIPTPYILFMPKNLITLHTSNSAAHTIGSFIFIVLLSHLYTHYTRETYTMLLEKPTLHISIARFIQCCCVKK